MKKNLASIAPFTYPIGMDNYKGFIFGKEFGFITFYNPDMEDGSGAWSGTASTIAEAREMIDELMD